MAAKSKTSKKPTKKDKNVNWVMAKAEDGTIQITYTIPWEKIEDERKKVAEEIGQTMEIPGFRKGKAPINKVLSQVPESQLIEHTLGHILPSMFGETIQKENLKPAMYPKFELVQAKENEDWQVRALTAELPEIKLGDYKKNIKNAANVDAIWTPDKGKDEDQNKKPSKEEKEQVAIQSLLNTVEATIPSVLLEEEVNARLSQLLERIEKLGLSLENYLASIGKSAEILRDEYNVQARNTLVLDIALNKIAEEEKLEPSKEDLQKMVPTDQELNEQQKMILENTLRKRAALDYLVSLM